MPEKARQVASTDHNEKYVKAARFLIEIKHTKFISVYIELLDARRKNMLISIVEFRLKINT